MKVFQILELPSELDKKETYLELLENERELFLETIFNGTIDGFSNDEGLHDKVISALDSYEAVCSDASDVGVNIVEKVWWLSNEINIFAFLSIQTFDINWDFIQSCFFCLTILTTIGNRGYFAPYTVTV